MVSKSMYDNKMQRNHSSQPGSFRTLVSGLGVGIVLVGVLAAPACGLLAREGSAAIARIAGRDIPLSDFETMLRATTAGEVPDALRSRLLDQYLEQQILLQEARNRRIEVSDTELDQAMARDGRAGGDDDEREKLRRALMVDRLLREVTSSTEITPDDEERFFREHAELFHQPELLILRQILLNDAELAAGLREQLVGDPEVFMDVAHEHSRSADQGLPRSYARDELPWEVVVALHELEPGEVSAVVEVPPAFLIFRLEERRAERRLSLDEARPGIRARLQESRSSDARRDLVGELRLKLRVRLFADNLPFEYVQEEPA
jgi:parvulin-like peptidyl-prolyl isomerase